MEPVRDGWCQHTDDGHFHALALYDGVWMNVGFSCLCVYDVSSEHGAVDLANPLVVDGMASLDVVVADGLSVIA